MTSDASDPGSDAGKCLREAGPDPFSSDGFLREILDHPAPVAEMVSGGMVVLDHDGIVRSFNAAAAGLFGYEPEEVIGRSMGLLITSEDREGQVGGIFRHDHAGE